MKSFGMSSVCARFRVKSDPRGILVLFEEWRYGNVRLSEVEMWCVFEPEVKSLFVLEFQVFLRSSATLTGQHVALPMKRDCHNFFIPIRWVFPVKSEVFQSSLVQNVRAIVDVCQAVVHPSSMMLNSRNFRVSYLIAFRHLSLGQGRLICV